MPDFLSIRNTLIGTTAFFLLATIILQATHTSPNCSYNLKGGSSLGCEGEFPATVCEGPAYGLGKNYQTQAGTVDVEISCPWKIRTLVISYASAFLLIIFLILTGLNKRMKFSVLLVVFRVLSVIGLITSGFFMIYDIITGYEFYLNQKWADFSFTQVIYIGTVVFTGLTLVSTLVLSVFGTGTSDKIDEDLSADLRASYLMQT